MRKAPHIRAVLRAVVLVALVPVVARAASQALLLAVSINGADTGKIGEFALDDGRLMARASELRDLGLRVPPAVAGTDPDVLTEVASLPGVSGRFDPATQSLHVTATDASRVPLQLSAGDAAGPAGHIESGTGATLNYDLTATSAGGQTVGTGFLDLRAFSRWGVISSQALVYAGGGPAGPGSTSAVRLDSTYTFSDPDALRRYRAGDFITGSLGWTRPVRLGGVQITSDFSLRPDLVTFPLPTFSGSAAVPSTVDVLINGNRLLSQQVGAGPFQIPQLPVVTGAGTVSLAVTNALGRQVVVTLPFYASSSLLSPGLQSYSAQLGLVRRNWGVISNDYGDPAGVAIYRRGISSAITIETDVEATDGVVKAGVGLVANLWNVAVMNASVAASGGGRSGVQYAVGIQRTGQVFSVGASATIASRGFRDVATRDGDPVPRLQLNANAGLSLGRFGAFGIVYAAVDRDMAPAPTRIYIPPGATLASGGPIGGGLITGGVALFQPAQHAHVLSASYSVQVRNMALSATAFRDFSASRSSGVLVSMTIPFGSRSSASASAGGGSGGRYGQLQAQRPATTIGDVGYQAYASDGARSHGFGQLQYKSGVALLTAGVDRSGRQTSMTAEAQGAVSVINGGVFASNTIDDSFAVVDTNGAANVHVLNENRPVGTTNSAGHLLVPNLRAFDANRLAIAPGDISADSSVDTTTREVRPQDRSGVVVKFLVKTSHAALLRLVDDAGHAVPLGSNATLAATGAIVPVGYDGEAYVEDLVPQNALLVQRPDGTSCKVAFAYRPIAGEIPTIGPLRCRI